MELRSNMQLGPLPGWVCPYCKGLNGQGNHYCSQCGYELSPDAHVQIAPRHNGLVIAVVSIITAFFLLVAGVGGYYVLHKKSERKEAVAYLQSRNKTLAASVALINQLSTERELRTGQGEDLREFLQRLEDEEIKAQKAFAQIKQIREEENKAKDNSLVNWVAMLDDNYYRQAEDSLRTYNQYISYRVGRQNNLVVFDQEVNKLETIFKSVRNEKEMSNSLLSLSKAMDDSAFRMKSLVTPSGLEESRDKSTQLIVEFSRIMKEYAASFESKDMERLMRADSDLKTYLTNDAAFLEVDNLERYYFDGLHTRFIELRRDADSYRTELIRSGVELDSDIIPVDIEGW
jgi:hypothetical protein